MTETYVDIYPPGTKVTIGDRIEGLVIKVEIRENRTVSYCVVFWNSNVRNETWMSEKEV